MRVLSSQLSECGGGFFFRVAALRSIPKVKIIRIQVVIIGDH